MLCEMPWQRVDIVAEQKPTLRCTPDKHLKVRRTRNLVLNSDDIDAGQRPAQSPQSLVVKVLVGGKLEHIAVRFASQGPKALFFGARTGLRSAGVSASAQRISLS